MARLDELFPYLCFTYGAVMTLALNSGRLARIADTRLPAHLVASWKSHRALAFSCLIIGGIWILQNIWLA